MGEKLVANLIMALALSCGIGSLVLFLGFPLGSLGLVQWQWSETGILWWDGLLSLAFFLQHSGMVRRQFRTRVYGPIPPPYHRALYSVASGITLAGVALLWQPSKSHLLALDGPFRWAALVPEIGALALFVWGAVVLRNLDLFGARAIKAHMRGSPEESSPFLVRGPYRWVRHPWYLAAIVLFWSNTDLTADRLLFNVLWTGWICVGTGLEESDLVRDFGDAYEKYRQQVPMLVPWHRPAAVR